MTFKKVPKDEDPEVHCLLMSRCQCFALCSSVPSASTHACTAPKCARYRRRCAAFARLNSTSLLLLQRTMSTCDSDENATSQTMLPLRIDGRRSLSTSESTLFKRLRQKTLSYCSIANHQASAQDEEQTEHFACASRSRYAKEGRFWY